MDWNPAFKYQCDQCDEVYVTQSTLSIHKQSKHGRIKYACDKCDDSFTTQNKLKKHEELKHE